jgi:hypothetical protein
LAIAVVNEVKTNISLANMKLKHDDKLDKSINVKLNYKLENNRGIKITAQRLQPITRADRTWARSDKEEANNFAARLENVLKPNDLPQNETFETKTNRMHEGTLFKYLNSLHLRITKP